MYLNNIKFQPNSNKKKWSITSFCKITFPTNFESNSYFFPKTNPIRMGKRNFKRSTQATSLSLKRISVFKTAKKFFFCVCKETQKI